MTVEAHQWFHNGDHPNDKVGQWIPDGGDSWYHGHKRVEGAVVGFFQRPEPEYEANRLHDICGYTWFRHGWINTLEGGHTVCPSDWIITGVRGEMYPCKDSIFKETYEEVIDA